MKLKLSLLIFVLSITNSFGQTLEIPIIDSVSVDSDLNVHLSWSYTDKASVSGYRIKRRVFDVSGVIDGSFVNIVTINDPNQTWFIDNTTTYSPTDAYNRRESYVVEAFHFDGTNYDYSNLSDEHKTIHLQDIQYDHCANQNLLSWAHYFGWTDSIESYEIYYKTGGIANPEFLVSIPSSDTSFIHSNLQANETYYYFIRAKHKNGINTSSSNYKIKTATQAIPPEFMNADQSEVIGKHDVLLSFTISTNSEINDFKLLRTQYLANDFDTIAKFDINTIPFQYTDSIDITKQYYYKVVGINDCKLEVKETNITSNIVLSQKMDEIEFGLVNLSWKSYHEYEAGLQTYKVFRQIGTSSPEELIQLADTFYSDPAGDLINDMIETGSFSGNICYYILAEENIGNSSGVLGQSTSNLSCIALEPTVIAPNAFNPQSYIERNNVFKPMVSFAKSYEMQIISRWGNVVFETNDINKAWDGRINGDYAREGTYIYVIKILAPNDEYFEKSGNITIFY